MPFISLRSAFARRPRRGVKARRRTELGLLVAAGVIIVATYILMILGNTSKVPSDLTPLLLCILALGGVTHVANRIFVPDANAVVMPIVFLLNGMGYVMITRIDLGITTRYAPLQAAWTAGGVAAYVVTLFVIRRSRDLDRYRYLLLAGGVILLLLPLVPGVGANINGARLWIHLGSFEFQPVEIGKIVLCVFFASYFADKRELLTIPTARLGNRLVLDPRPLVPIVLAWGFAILVMSLEHDIGFSALLFTLFIGLLWITTGRTGYLVLGLVMFGVGAYITTKYFNQTHVRVQTWLNPWKYADGNGRQLVQSWYALGSGGVGGSGLGLGFGAYSIPNSRTDFIFATIGEEMGLMGSSMIVVAYMLLVGAGLRIAQAARSEFAKLVAAGLTIIIGFQAFFIIGGIVRILPLTGITLPFVSYGGSALIANYVLVALLMRISDEGTAAADAAEQAKYEENLERRRRLLTGS
ncbi:MAG TPA: FtsW/RodA/SpoVE family cell cycle protein [Acidimicrobiales bacterium]